MFGFGSPKKKKGGDKDKRSKEKVNEIQSTTPVTSDDKKMLKGRHTPKQASGQFYFVQKDPGRTDSVRDSGDNTETIELNRNAVQAIGAAASTNTNDNKAVAAVAADSLYEPKAVNRNLVSTVLLFSPLCVMCVLFWFFKEQKMILFALPDFSPPVVSYDTQLKKGKRDVINEEWKYKNG